MTNNKGKGKSTASQPPKKDRKSIPSRKSSMNNFSNFINEGNDKTLKVFDNLPIRGKGNDSDKKSD